MHQPFITALFHCLMENETTTGWFTERKGSHYICDLTYCKQLLQI